MNVTNCREVEKADHETLHLLPILDLLPGDGGCGVQANDLNLVLAADDGKLDALLASTLGVSGRPKSLGREVLAHGPWSASTVPVGDGRGS